MAGVLSDVDIAIDYPVDSPVDWIIHDRHSLTSVCANVIGEIDSVEADQLSDSVYALLASGLDNQTADSRYEIAASDRDHLDFKIVDPETGSTLCLKRGEGIGSVEAEELSHEVFRTLISGGKR